MTALKDYQDLVTKNAPTPNIVTFCWLVIKQAGGTKLENVAVESMKLGGVQKRKLISNAFEEFAKITDSAPASDSVHPSLFAVLKSK
jgi:hypothetical protein